MQVIFDENEIMEALNSYANSRVKIPEGKVMNVDFIMGRAPAGPRAEVNFVDPSPEEVAAMTEAVKEVDKIVEENSKDETPAPTSKKKKKAATKKKEQAPETKEMPEPQEPVKEEPVPEPETPPASEEKADEAPQAETVGGAPATPPGESTPAGSLFNF